ncbi:MAG: alpha/beta hydrolase [Aeromicrobium sp.]
MTTRLTVAVEPRYFRSSSIQARLLATALRHTVRPTLSLWAHLPFDLQPPNLVDLIAKVLPVHEGTHVRRISVSAAEAEWISGPGVSEVSGLADDHVILYLHGGAFLTCGLNTHRRLVSRISAAADRPVLNLAYRQMPEVSITESINDGVEAFRWLMDQGYSADRITIAGDSAGGYMAFGIARAVIDAGWGQPEGVVAISPLLDLDSDAKRAHRNADRCDVFPLSALERFSKIAQRRERRDGVPDRPCPVDMDVEGLPPALIQIGSREILMPDAEIMANRLVGAGIPCEFQVWSRQVHVFQAASWVPEAQRAVKEVALFVQSLEDQRLSDLARGADVG